MADSPNLEVIHLPANASNPDVVVNAAFDLIDSIISGSITINFATDANLTLTTTGVPAQWQYFYYNLTDTGTVLTTGRDVIVPVNKKQYFVKNATAQSLIVKTSAGTGVTITAAGTGLVYCDGTNVISIS